MKKIAYILIAIILFSCKTEMSVYDFDDNEYKTVKIGTQVWLRENLKTTHYNNGDELYKDLDSIAWDTIRKQAFCYYNNDSTIPDNYGLLYNWFSIQKKGLCPEGYHVPDTSDWNVLISYLGGKKKAQMQLLDSNMTYWRSPYRPTNLSEFTAIPAGGRFKSSANNGFINKDEFCFFWTSIRDYTPGGTWDIDSNQIPIFVDINFKRVKYYGCFMSNGLSIRCIKNK